MKNIYLLCGVASLGLGVGAGAEPARVEIRIDHAPADGLVAGHVDLTAAARWGQALPVMPRLLGAVDAATGKEVPLQFVPDPDFQAQTHAAGTILVQLPSPGSARLRLVFQSKEPAPAEAWNGKVTTSSYIVEHDPVKQGGLPWRVTFRASGKSFDTMRWNNRVHHRQLGSFCVCDDPQSSVERVSEGPLCTVVRVRGRFVQGGKPAAALPAAVYDWYYFHDRPLAYVTATIRQEKPFTWHELHFLEMNYPAAALPRWAGGEPRAEGSFQGTHKSLPQSEWGVVHDGQNGIGMFRCGQALLYDGGAGSYLQAHGDSVWQEWSGTRRDFSAWLWIGSDAQPPAAVRAAAQTPSGGTHLAVFVDAVHDRIAAARERLKGTPVAQRQRAWWQVQGASQLEAQGRLDEAVRVADGAKPAPWTTTNAGDLGVILERTADGIRLVSLFDADRDVCLVSSQPLPLFSLKLREAGKDEPVTLSSEQGWSEVELVESGAQGVALQWWKPRDGRLGDLHVLARLIPDASNHALRWTIAVDKVPPSWSVWRVVFPQVAVSDLGPKGAVFFPKAAGEVQRGVWSRSFRFAGTYPSGWTSMAYLAAYDEAQQTGLYVGVHDPWGSTKDLLAESRPSEAAVVLAFDHPAPDMGQPGNHFELSGEAVWQLLRGDWFDAALTYRNWVRKEAKWYPKLTAEGRADTPKWMRELSVWALDNGTQEQCVPRVKAFTEFLQPPAAVHWYQWHQIPFDNDYPHYFPTKPGFADGVRALQSSGTYVMPYINGRLWDTRDRGQEDFEFTKVALPAVSKNEKGEPYIEMYGSKEQDGSRVRLGVMCPSTALWQSRVKEIVLRLMNECGVKGVYIDQIAAAQPTLCFDKTHGHPLGGGHWWTEGYWKMLEGIRKEMPADCMITTECNGEPYIRVLDGYLTWHWQYDGQVPAFPAVYGGAIQMFGRSYGGGPSQDLALRMRAGQQLVFGEQIGWLGPDRVLGHKENGAFFRDVVHLRRRLAGFFSAGEMARPPRLVGTVPAVRADWQWGGTDWVTTDAVLTGAWFQPAARRLVLVFVNVSDDAVTAHVDFDTRPYGFAGPAVSLTKITPEGAGERDTSSPHIERPATFPPRTAWAWEVTVPGS